MSQLQSTYIHCPRYAIPRHVNTSHLRSVTVRIIASWHTNLHNRQSGTWRGGGARHGTLLRCWISDDGFIDLFPVGRLHPPHGATQSLLHQRRVRANMRARTSETASLEAQSTGRVVNYGRRSTYTREICMTANFARAPVEAGPASGSLAAQRFHLHPNKFPTIIIGPPAPTGTALHYAISRLNRITGNELPYRFIFICGIPRAYTISGAISFVPLLSVQRTICNGIWIVDLFAERVSQFQVWQRYF